MAAPSRPGSRGLLLYACVSMSNWQGTAGDARDRMSLIGCMMVGSGFNTRKTITRESTRAYVLLMLPMQMEQNAVDRMTGDSGAPGAIRNRKMTKIELDSSHYEQCNLSSSSSSSSSELMTWETSSHGVASPAPSATHGTGIKATGKEPEIM